jgi:hypothetical protein
MTTAKRRIPDPSTARIFLTPCEISANLAVTKSQSRPIGINHMIPYRGANIFPLRAIARTITKIATGLSSTAARGSKFLNADRVGGNLRTNKYPKAPMARLNVMRSKMLEATKMAVVVITVS